MEAKHDQAWRDLLLDAVNEPVPSFTRRDVELPAIPNKAIAVVGMRRTGKSTYLWQLLSDRLAQGAERPSLLYLGFDDDRLAGLTLRDLGGLLEEYFRLYPAGRQGRRVTLFLDEIQVVPGWESFVRRVLDTEAADVFVSGSSAKLLSRELATNLRGRAMEAQVFPFSFREFLRHRRREPKAPADRLPRAQRTQLGSDLIAYLREGGFPEAQGANPRDRARLLRGYVDSVLLRDVIERHNVTHPVALSWLTRHLLANAAGTFSIHRFTNDLRSQGIGVGKDSLYAFLDHLTDAFLLRVVPLATDSERQRMVNPRKVYPVDPALIPLFDRTGRANEGHALETAVAIELERRGAEIHYVKTPKGHEVDFLARYPEGTEELVQVCARFDDPATLDRELRALAEAAEMFPRATRTLVTLAPEAVTTVPLEVEVAEAGAWMLREC
jgi:predicted AAA+ superfamily ATPase